MKKNLLVGILISTFQIGLSQITFDWARHFGTNNNEWIDEHIQDDENNTYLLGYFNDELDLNIGIGVDKVIASNQSDLFIAKFDSIGNLKWKYNSGENNPQRVRDVLIQDSLIFYTWGDNKISSISLETGNLKSTLTISPNIYIRKFEFDKEGNIIIIAASSPGIDLDPSENDFIVPNLGSVVSFICSFSDGGEFNWANFFPALTTDIGLDIDNSKSRILTFGTFQNTQDFSLGGNLNLVSSFGETDCFYSEFDLNGSLNIFKNYGSSKIDRHVGKYDSKGNIILFGSFSGPLLNTPNGDQILSQGGLNNLFGIKINNNFNEVWFTGWTEADAPFLSDFDYADDLIAYTLLQSSTSNKISSRKIDLSNGNILSKRDFYSFSSYINDLNFSVSRNRQIFLSGQNSLSQVDYDPTVQNFSFPNSGGLDAFVTVLKDCSPTIDTNAIDTCTTEFTWSNGDGEIYDTDTISGPYISVINDCEIITYLNLNISPVATINLGSDTAVCENENYGIEFDAGSFNDYLWLPNNETSQIISVTTPGDYIVNVTDLNGCQASDTVSFSIDAAPTVNLGNDTTIHIGESLTLDAGTHDSYEWQDASTDQTYEIQASAVGTEYYWVKVTNQSSCSDTDTVAVTIDFNVGVAEFSSSNFELFPNPTNGNLTISTKDNAEILEIRIYDLASKEVFFSGSETNINISNLERATYIVEIKTTNGTNFQKLIKK